ncbi:glycosyltransferase [Marinitoga aeolica]|uniref:Glycosyltransferase n=1 Tax=Marinitoga aeolica TaxID=2809031 RepID=A0ABY8PML2_9BACT|nr:glycosyltransferase [Marinitoga aeolica]WGS63887.1 glycosyltransferase [Marinitoga aeolica]
MAFTTCVVMCTYNGEKFLEEQLDSILNQSKKIDKIYITDDNSTDNTIEILKKYEREYYEIIDLKINDKNIGYIKNFEKTLKRAKEDIIFLADQDDIWQKYKIEKILKFFHENPWKSYVFSDAYLKEGDQIKDYSLFDIYFKKKKRKHYEKNPIKSLLPKNFVTGATLAIQKKYLNYAFPFTGKIPHDYEIVLKLSYFSEGDYIEDKLITYRMHKNQTMGVHYGIKKFFRIIKNLDEVFNKEKNILLLNNLYKAFEEINHAYKNNSNQEIENLIENYISFLKFRRDLYLSNEKKIKIFSRLRDYLKFDNFNSLFKDIFSI